MWRVYQASMSSSLLIFHWLTPIRWQTQASLFYFYYYFFIVDTIIDALHFPLLPLLTFSQPPPPQQAFTTRLSVTMCYSYMFFGQSPHLLSSSLPHHPSPLPSAKSVLQGTTQRHEHCEICLIGDHQYSSVLHQDAGFSLESAYANVIIEHQYLDFFSWSFSSCHFDSQNTIISVVCHSFLF